MFLQFVNPKTGAPMPIGITTDENEVFNTQGWLLLPQTILAVLVEHEPIEHWQDGGDEYHRDKRTEEDNGSHWRPQRIVLYHHRQYAYRGGCRCKEDRAHAALASLEGGFLYR